MKVGEIMGNIQTALRTQNIPYQLQAVVVHELNLKNNYRFYHLTINQQVYFLVTEIDYTEVNELFKLNVDNIMVYFDECPWEIIQHCNQQGISVLVDQALYLKKD